MKHALVILFTAAIVAISAHVQALAATAQVTLDVTRPGRTINPYVLGNNVKWSEEEPGVFTADDSTTLSDKFMDYSRRLSPTVLRYPGGAEADVNHWQEGIGPLDKRPEVKDANGETKKIRFGTDEFLAYSKTLGAAPLITVNVATGTPEEAAAWVRYTNRADSPLKVRYWEIDNEPYLNPVTPAGAMTPEEYGKRANVFIRAMKAADPSILVGIPLQTDKVPGTDTSWNDKPGFNDIVLRTITEPFDFVAVHNSYFPVTLHKEESADEMYLATMGATQVVLADMEATRRQLARYHPGKTFPIAITEYNTLYSLDIAVYGLIALVTSGTDRYIDSLASAMYTTDALMTFSAMPDMLMANFWSLNGNWWFGAIGHDGDPRATFHVLEAYRSMLGGKLVPVSVQGPTMQTPKAGRMPAVNNVPIIAAQAVVKPDNSVNAVLLNKSLNEPMTVNLAIPAMAQGAITLQQLTAEDPFDHHPTWSEQSVSVSNGQATITLPPHSVTFAVIR